MTKKQIVVIGSSNVDFIMQLPHLPALGETVTDGVFMQTFGGKGANQAVAAARAGGIVTFITGLGEDAYAAAMRENFERDGIDTSRILLSPGVASGSALVMFDRQGDNYITVAPGANAALTPAYIAACADRIRAAAYVVMQQEIPLDAIEKVLEIAASAGTPVLFNYAPVREKALAVDSRIHGLIVNEVEAVALTGLPVANAAQAQDAARQLREKGPQFVVLTLGADGALLDGPDGVLHLPAFPVAPTDTTAAGDVFCGAFAAALTEGRTLPESARFASAASALSVTRAGAQPSIPYRSEIDAFLTER